MIAARSKLHTWAEALGDDLRWLAILLPGNDPKVIFQPGTAVNTTDVLREPLDLIAPIQEQEPHGAVIRCQDIVYLALFERAQPWLVLGLRPEVTLESLQLIMPLHAA